MCNEILARLVCGEPLSSEQRAHVAGCPTCAATVAASTTRATAPVLPRLSPPTPAGLRARARRRTAARLTVAAAAVAALIALFVSLPGPAPVSSSPEPDLLALLDTVDEVSADRVADLPDADALALLDPLGGASTDPLAQDPFYDLVIPRSTP